MRKFNEKERGAASLPIVMALLILIIVVGLGITSLGLTEGLISAGQNQSSKALAYAETGVKDALQRLARNKNYSCASADCYSMEFITNGCATNEACVRVSVSANAGSGADPKIITSKGRTKSNVRQIKVWMEFDSSLNGEIASTTWQEITD